MTMEPTMQLRWVERAMEPDVSRLHPVKVRVLQQLWTDGYREIRGVKKLTYPATEEWRDIPVTEES